ncbi:hypothetical protein BR93DRAFT_300308 [Coniochaeta sp. PMI_546]|nr:hypothetical protein BR93DRAFT_300308 [Coniochaeta sp. PMI_546]
MSSITLPRRISLPVLHICSRAVTSRALCFSQLSRSVSAFYETGRLLCIDIRRYGGYTLVVSLSGNRFFFGAVVIARREHDLGFLLFTEWCYVG